MLLLIIDPVYTDFNFAVSLHFMYYNFARVHQSLRVTPAMEAGVSDHVWTVEEIVGLVARLCAATSRTASDSDQPF